MIEKGNWSLYNQRLKDRGNITIQISPAAEKQLADLKIKNKDKVGAPFRFSDSLILGLFAVKCAFKLGYRQLEGFIEGIKSAVGLDDVPDFRTIDWRMIKLKGYGLNIDIKHDSHNLDVSIDSSEWKESNSGEYRSMRYGNEKEWRKVHIMVDTHTKRIYGVKVTNSNVGDSKVLRELVEPIKEYVKRVFADGAYDSEDNFRYCDDNNIEPIIPVRRNSTAEQETHRRKRVVEQLRIWKLRGGTLWHNLYLTRKERDKNQKEWKKASEYYNRESVEQDFGALKGIFGEYVFSRRDDMMEREIFAKINLYNSFLM